MQVGVTWDRILRSDHSPGRRGKIVHNTKSLVILSVVAVILVIGIGICTVINPWATVGLAPILVAIAVIIKAISGHPDPPDE